MDLIVNDSEESSWKRKEHPDEEEYLLFIIFTLLYSRFLGLLRKNASKDQLSFALFNIIVQLSLIK